MGGLFFACFGNSREFVDITLKIEYNALLYDSTGTATAHHFAIHKHEESDEQQQWQHRKYYHIKIVPTLCIAYFTVKNFISF